MATIDTRTGQDWVGRSFGRWIPEMHRVLFWGKVEFFAESVAIVDWWVVSASGGPQPRLRRVIDRFGPDRRTRMLRLIHDL